MSNTMTPEELKKLYSDTLFNMRFRIDGYFGYATISNRPYDRHKDYYVHQRAGLLRKDFNKLKHLNTYQSPSNRYSNEDLVAIEQGIDVLVDLFNKMADDKIVRHSLFMDTKYHGNYGQIDQSFLDAVFKKQRKARMALVNLYSKIINERVLTDYRLLSEFTSDYFCVQAAWHIALVSPYSIDDFNALKELYYRVYKIFSMEMFCAELCLTLNNNGRNLVGQKIKKYLEDDTYAKYYDDMDKLSSAMCWMKLEDEEKMVLEYMFSKNIPLDEVRYQRLSYLTNHNANAPKSYSPSFNDGNFYFDVASIQWKEEDYQDFFKELDLQNKRLAYSLAIQHDDHDLLLPPNISMPSHHELANVLNQNFVYEYDRNEVQAHSVRAVILSDVNEGIDGVLIQVNHCPSMKILVNVMKIGKKMNVRFYTLFSPQSSVVSNQMQEAITLYKQTSPVTSLWEKSVKDNVLSVLEKVINRNHTQTSTNTFDDYDAF